MKIYIAKGNKLHPIAKLNEWNVVLLGSFAHSHFLRAPFSLNKESIMNVKYAHPNS
jgi:hypothetical protein